MKFHLLICLCMLFCGCMVGQTPNHTTISGLSIQYKALPQTTLSVTQSTNTILKSVVLATLTLNNAAQVASINFKVANSSGAIEYESDFLLNSNSSVETSGKKTFQKASNNIFINVPKPLLTGSYTYYVVTKSNTGIPSSTFILTQ